MYTKLDNNHPLAYSGKRELLRMYRIHTQMVDRRGSSNSIAEPLLEKLGHHWKCRRCILVWKWRSMGQQTLKERWAVRRSCAFEKSKRGVCANTPVPQAWWPLTATSRGDLSLELADYKYWWRFFEISRNTLRGVISWTATCEALT